MKRSERLNSILELATAREQEAAQQLGEMTRKLENARRNLDNLRSFQDNYSQKFRDTGDQGLGMRQLLEYRAFLAKINGAVLEQERIVGNVEKNLAQSRTHWEATRRQTLGMKTVVDKARAEERHLEERRRQAEEDERAGRRRDRGGDALSMGY